MVSSNPIALMKAKIVYNFGLSECNRVKSSEILLHSCMLDDNIINSEKVFISIKFWLFCCSVVTSCWMIVF